MLCSIFFHTDPLIPSEPKDHSTLHLTHLFSNSLIEGFAIPDH